MGKHFGTDGIRGVVNETIDAELAYRVGSAAATVLAQDAGKRLRVMIGKDTRISSGMLEAALSAGLCSAGADVAQIGVLPTPAVAYLTVNSEADLGVVISASHNPFEHNGIKMFGSNGFKLNDSLEERIEHYIDKNALASKMTGGSIGRIGGDHRYWTDEYIAYLASASAGRYTGRIAIDCANGAASETASALFSAIGADYQIFSDKPDGVNINSNCGSIHIDVLKGIVKTGLYSVGFAFDGDADRCIVVDERGEAVDGDVMLAAFARAMLREGALKGGGAVGTIVSNSGMDAFARRSGFKFHRAAVGDRNVLEMMWETGCNIGGESSGHLIFSDDATTGDGQLTAVKFLNLLVASGCSVSELAADVPKYPQVMPSFVLSGGAAQRDAIMSHPALLDEIENQQRMLGDDGRVLIRPSGTEPVIRVLVEAKTERLAAEKAEIFIKIMQSL